MLRVLFGITALVLAAGALAPTAVAVEPVKSEFEFTDTAVLTEVCAFPVTVEFSVSGTEIDFFDEGGNLTRIQIHNTEQDVFTANGKTLVGLPYTFNLQIRVNPVTGEFEHIFASGVASRVPLPGGDVFFTAGRIDFAAHPGATFLLQPDVGVKGNIAGFCAALAP